MKEYTPLDLAPEISLDAITPESSESSEKYSKVRPENAVAVDVHGRCVPASHVHVVGHVADHLTELLGEITGSRCRRMPWKPGSRWSQRR